MRHFFHGANALLRLVSRVGGSAGYVDPKHSHALSSGLQRSLGTGSGFQAKNMLALSSFLFNEFPGGRATHFLVGVDQQLDSTAGGHTKIPQGLQGMEGNGDPGFHVQNSRSVSEAIFDTERTLADGTSGPDSVHMAQQQDLGVSLPDFGQYVIANFLLGYFGNCSS